MLRLGRVFGVGGIRSGYRMRREREREKRICGYRGGGGGSLEVMDRDELL